MFGKDFRFEWDGKQRCICCFVDGAAEPDYVWFTAREVDATCRQWEVAGLERIALRLRKMALNFSAARNVTGLRNKRAWRVVLGSAI